MRREGGRERDSFPSAGPILKCLQQSQLGWVKAWRLNLNTVPPYTWQIQNKDVGNNFIAFMLH